MALRLVASGNGWVVADKPAGQLVHPTRPGGPVTLRDELCGYFGYELANGGQVSIINRLDRETSGAVLVALDAGAARRLAVAMQERRIGKEYAAIVFGWPDWEERIVDAPLLRRALVDPDSPTWVEQIVHPDGVSARTRFRVVERYSDWHGLAGRYARIEARPETGRMHQIRVHLASLGHPVVGDKLYAAGPERYVEFVSRGWCEALAERLIMRRHALHSLALVVPEDDGWRRVVCALPGDMGGEGLGARGGVL